MKMQDIREIARQRGVKSANLRKAELIRAIQRKEGNVDCYGMGRSASCGQDRCLWRDDCE